MTSISVVIPVYNGEKTINDLLISLKKQSTPPFEVIVIDNNSTDKTADVIKKWHMENPLFPLKLAAETKQGRSYARNKGITVASGDYIAMFDADCVVQKDWIRNCLKCLETGDFTAVGGIVEGYKFETPTEKALHFLHCPKSLKNGLFKEVDEWDIMRGSMETNNVVVKAEILRSVGGFDGDTYRITGEDFDLFLRLLKNGGKLIGHHKRLVVFHQHRAYIGSMVKQVFFYGYCYAKIVSVHYGHRMVIIGRRYHICYPFPFTVWIRLSKAFITTSGCFVAFFLFPLKYTFLLICLAFLIFIKSWFEKLKQTGARTSLAELLEFTGITFVHKIALAMGHIIGSIKLGICCI